MTQHFGLNTPICAIFFGISAFWGYTEKTMPERLPSRQVVILFASVDRHFSEIRNGIIEYTAHQGHWLIDFWEDFDYGLKSLKRWKPDGIIVNLWDKKQAVGLKRLGIPFVSVTARWDPDYPAIDMDDEAVGRMAAEHLLSKGLQHFIFVGYPGEPYSDRRQRGFCRILEDKGYTVQVLDTALEGTGQRYHEKAILKALKQSPYPVGVMACHDIAAAHLIKLCNKADICMPDDVSIIGVDNNYCCEFTRPKISSVETGAKRIGLQAAAMLDQVMNKRTVNPRIVLVPPLHIVTRQSTDIIALDDPIIAQALRFIQQNAHLNITVQDILNQVPVCRRTLQLKFVELIGRTPSQEIRRVHVEKAKQLLVDTDLKMSEISRRCGFCDAPQCTVVFKKETGLTPRQFREQLKHKTLAASPASEAE